MTERLYGGIEAGGTKFVCMVASAPTDIRAETRFPTTTPAETLGRAIAFFREAQQKHGPLAAVGIASFGPLDPRPGSPTYGWITATPKPAWSNVDVVGAVRQGLETAIAFDTDVNGAALGEWRWGAARGLDTFIYLTVGTGIGGGGMVNGKLMHGLLHPEMGHIPLPHDWKADDFSGVCPFHGDCLEGLASGLALERRWGRRAESLPPEHPAWRLEADYLALGIWSLICTLSPQRVVLGGGVMAAPGLLEQVRQRVRDYLNGYVRSPQILEQIETYLVPPGLGNRAGVLGAIALAERLVAGGEV